mmetsp:Transcript_49774/g.131978  ORF Transcript_49774/g.131978 Transcript_49774/m.131978 type:complete len:181 (-) Transcript_49774:114-656(-)|eukprot:CAMPEP_0194512606 /NCGR_PEP_ID=MMETSP0253-20130528/44652_1 /TAXON_ID=2966 /ORGANISM="Noctiluca scintillans" /LENGTH=180 /DNA_ID=CAMNT_0039356077 /DNA_START=115 /DNA_END=657 /DNA_ORIENTATION=+
MWRPSGEVTQETIDAALNPNLNANPYLNDRYRWVAYNNNPPVAPPVLDAGRLMEGCTARAAMGGIGGGVMGILMGGFFHTMQPMNIDTTLSTWDQIRQSYKGFGEACRRMSRNFAKLGVLYASVDCFLERERAAKDIPNSMYAGCVTGGILAFQSGPQAMALGCGGFALFSGIIESFMAH